MNFKLPSNLEPESMSGEPSMSCKSFHFIMPVPSPVQKLFNLCLVHVAMSD